ncbi:MAG TPA: dihydrofolate reductase family protein [Ktedonobacterales bacterium]|nr:dihydrofolate reductase family protein [Ktedonobacterales bacterium]
MRKVMLLMHTSLDGFVAGPNGEMEWIAVDDEMWTYVTAITDSADTVIFGRVTYQGMASYWPTAAEQPTATQHDIHHARWVNPALKLVVSRTLEQAEWGPARLVKDHIAEEIAQLKQQPGKNLLMIGSPGLAQTFMRAGLIDDYWLNVNPVALGSGVPLFANLAEPIPLKLAEAKAFRSGVVGLHYQADKK